MIDREQLLERAPSVLAFPARLVPLHRVQPGWLAGGVQSAGASQAASPRRAARRGPMSTAEVTHEQHAVCFIEHEDTDRRDFEKIRADPVSQSAYVRGYRHIASSEVYACGQRTRTRVTSASDRIAHIAGSGRPLGHR